MTEPNSPRPPRRSNADYRWTRPKIMAFLRALVPTLSVAEAARRVGMSRQSAYRLRARLGPEFAQLWDEGLAIGLRLRQAAGAASSPSVSQGDIRGVTLAPQGYGRGVTLGSQGDMRAPQGDTFRAQGDGFRPQGDA